MSRRFRAWEDLGEVAEGNLRRVWEEAVCDRDRAEEVAIDSVSLTC